MARGDWITPEELALSLRKLREAERGNFRGYFEQRWAPRLRQCSNHTAEEQCPNVAVFAIVRKPNWPVLDHLAQDVCDQCLVPVLRELPDKEILVTKL